jgi:hypothetical protein
MANSPITLEMLGYACDIHTVERLSGETDVAQ